MTAVQNATDEYVLGNSAHEQERLKMQARFLEKWTEQFFLLAGLQPGMRVLDLGCGMGDVSLLAARLVGPSGQVVGIDRDPVVIAKARGRIHSDGRQNEINLVHTDLFEFQADQSFDAVVGRYILLYQADPVDAIRHAAKQVRPDGIIVFHEGDLGNRIPSDPSGSLIEETYALLAETFRRCGYWVDLGLRLTRLFLEAGLPWPAIKAEVPVGGEPGSFIYRWFAESLRSILPRVEEFGLGRASDLDVDTLVARMDAEAHIRRAQVIGPLQYGAWARKRIGQSIE